MRRRLFAVLLLGVVLFASGLLVVAETLAEQDQRQSALQIDSDRVATELASAFERARSLSLLLAQSPAFVSSGGTAFRRPAAERALAYLEELYAGTIDEACLIDDRGHELARVTDGRAAAAADLSTEEADNAFFLATLELASGQVHQSRPYVSPDTGEWVLANTTWIPRPGGGRLLVHFEITLESYRQRTGTVQEHVAIVDRGLRHVVLQDDAVLPATDPVGAFPSAARAGDQLVPKELPGDGPQPAVSPVTSTTGNSNDWAVVRWSTASASVLPLWAGAGGTATGVVLILTFLVVLRRQQNALHMAARLDPLTGMANRKALEEALQDAIDAARAAGGERVAVLMIDLDGFKQVNDTLGHDKGDVVLQEMGRRLHANTFEHDTAARLGGDEFAVVLRRLRETDDVAAVAHRLREALIRPIEIDGVARFVGASIGVAVLRGEQDTGADLLRSADAAMYQAKTGREGMRIYEAGTLEEAHDQQAAAELLLAIENEDISLAFQPQFSLEDGASVGVEALARWCPRGSSGIAPSVFVPLAEQTGLIRQLTHLTLRLALDEAKAWHRAGVEIPVSVNLSARLACDRSLPGYVHDLLMARDLPGGALVLEITESVMVQDLPATVEVLRQVRAHGVRIELDDFGTGYASFKALHELPLDGVKIDRDLVNDDSPSGRRLLAATVDSAHRLGLHVVAEGIEDEPTRLLLRLLDAQTAQGYLLARPMSAEAVRALLGVPVTAWTDDRPGTRAVSRRGSG